MWVQSLVWEDPLEEGNPLQYSCLENPMDRGAWRATVHRVTKSQTQLKQLSMHAHIHQYLEIKYHSTVQYSSDAQSCPTLMTLWTDPAKLLCPWDSPGKNTGVGCPPPGDLPNPGIKPTSPAAPALQLDSLPLNH